tara:strand:+ start:234 stop:1604 length:1371 start_codon:yes stop_codon:yes gene_type:complete
LSPRDLAAKYGDRLRDIAKDQKLGRLAVARLLTRWTGEEVSVSRARRVWDIVRSTESSTEGAQAVTVTKPGPLDRVLAAQGVKIRTLDDLLRYTETDLNVWRVVRHRVNTWQQAQKTKEGPRTVQLFQIRAELERILKPLDAPALVRLKAPQPVARLKTGLRRAVLLGDTQIGVRWGPRYERLTPIHDPQALDLAVQICAEAQPESVVVMGDLLDVAAFGTYDTGPDLRQTSAPSIAIAHYWLAQLRAACPDAEIVIVEGNHDARIRKAVARQMPEIANIQAAGDDRSVMDIERLLGLEALDIQWVGSPYPKGWMLFDRIRCEHGSTVRAKGGATVAAMAVGAVVDTVCGHIHRREQAARVIKGRHGSKIVQVMSVGCLTRTDGAVPPGGDPDWHQAIGFCSWDPESDHVSMHSVPIIDGRIHWRDRVYLAQDAQALAEQTAKATGWRQIRGGYDG